MLAEPCCLRRHEPRSDLGFTLVELITVLVILGILAAFIAPKMFDSQVFAARGYADELASSLQYAQSVAASSGCAVQMTVNAAGYSARQRPAAGATCALNGAYTLPIQRSDGTTLSGTSPSGVSVTPNITVTFDQRGYVAGAAPPTLQIASFTLTIDPKSGYVDLQ